MQITKRFEFDAGHRVTYHKAKCRSLHGHRYCLEVTIKGEIIDKSGHPSQGMVVDFADLKRFINNNVIEELDHCFIVWQEDKKLISFLQDDGSKHLVVPFVPTVENLCLYIRKRIESLLSQSECTNLKLANIRLFETPNSWADA